MKTVLYLLGIALLLSCQKDPNPCGCVIIDIGVDMSVVDKNGTDLLDPENPQSIDKSKIKLFYPENGTLKEVYKSNMDNPRDFKIYHREGENYRMHIYTDKPITYIQWNEADMDTLKCEYTKTDNSTICTKVWFNNAPVYDNKNGTERYFQIVK